MWKLKVKVLEDFFKEPLEGFFLETWYRKLQETLQDILERFLVEVFAEFLENLIEKFMEEFLKVCMKKFSEMPRKVLKKLLKNLTEENFERISGYILDEFLEEVLGGTFKIYWINIEEISGKNSVIISKAIWKYVLLRFLEDFVEQLLELLKSFLEKKT